MRAGCQVGGASRIQGLMEWLRILSLCARWWPSALDLKRFTLNFQYIHLLNASRIVAAARSLGDQRAEQNQKQKLNMPTCQLVKSRGTLGVMVLGGWQNLVAIYDWAYNRMPTPDLKLLSLHST